MTDICNEMLCEAFSTLCLIKDRGFLSRVISQLVDNNNMLLYEQTQITENTQAE